MCLRKRVKSILQRDIASKKAAKAANNGAVVRRVKCERYRKKRLTDTKSRRKTIE